MVLVQAGGEDSVRYLYCDCCPKDTIFSENNIYTSFTTSVIGNQPGMEPGKCRESWAFLS